MAHAKSPADRLTGIFARFVHSKVSGSALLLVSTAAALILANSWLAETYVDLLYKKVGFSWGAATFALSAWQVRPRGGWRR